MTIMVLIGLALVVGGAVMVVQGVQGRQANARNLGAGLALAGLVVALLSTSFVVIPAGNVGVVFNALTGIQSRALGEGAHIVFPIIQQVTLYDGRQKEITLSQATNDVVSARSSEGLEIDVDVTILYQIDRDRAPALHRDIGPNYREIRIRPEVRAQVRDGIAEFRAADLISTQRADLQRRIESTLVSNLEGDSIRVRSVLLRDVRIPTSITTAIEEKQAAEQQIEVEENRRRQSEISAQRAVIEAEGQRDAAVARAEGEAAALRLRGEVIRENPEIIQLEVAQRLAPSLQTIMLPTEGNFLLDLRSIGQGSNSIGSTP